MITLKEILSILLALIILAFSNSFLNLTPNIKLFLNSMIFFAIILAVYITSKKLMAYYLEAEEETKIWTFSRYGLYERAYFKTPVPIGLILPFLLSIVSLGNLKWFAVLESEVKPTIARAAKRHDFYSFSEMTEWHLALISASGVIAMFFLAILSYLLNFPDLARLSIYFASFNLLPIGKLDGTRIFFGSRKAVLWIVLVVIDLIGLAYAFLMP